MNRGVVQRVPLSDKLQSSDPASRSAPFTSLPDAVRSCAPLATLACAVSTMLRRYAFAYLCGPQVLVV